MALSLYRKYRPKTFADVVGQEHVEHTLLNAIASGTVAHAYLFCGPRGTGKTTTARLLAKALLCEQGPGKEPDGTCEQCVAVAEGVHPDVFELDAASRTGVDNVREEIVGRVDFAPTKGRYKIYIIDEVHMLSTAAFNALLKTLEEPPDHVVFVLCTTDPHKVIETIQSRCQRFDFKRLSISQIAGYLERICKAESFEYEPEALEYLASRSAGGMRDAVTALEQAAVFTDGHIRAEEVTGLFGQLGPQALFELTGHIARNDAASCLVWLDRLVASGIDMVQLARELAAHVRNLYVASIISGDGGSGDVGGVDGGSAGGGGGDGSTGEILNVPAQQVERYREQAASFGGPDRLSHALGVCGELIGELKSAPDARLATEIALVKLCRPQSELTLEALAARIEALEAGATGVASAGADVGVSAETTTADAERNGRTGSAPLPTTCETSPLRKDPDGTAASGADSAGAADNAAGGTEAEHEPEVLAEPETETLTHTAAGEMSNARLFAALLTAVKRKDTATGALLTGVTLERTQAGYVLLFPKEAAFSLKIATGKDAAKIIGDAFAEVVGHPVDYECRTDATGALREALSEHVGGEDPEFSTAEGGRAESAPLRFTSEVSSPENGVSARPTSEASSPENGVSARPTSEVSSPEDSVPARKAMDESTSGLDQPEPDIDVNFDVPMYAAAAAANDPEANEIADELRSIFGEGVQITEDTEGTEQ